MSEFEFNIEEIKEAGQVLKKWVCESCDKTHSSWKSKPVSCVQCGHGVLKAKVSVNTVPVTTGFETELKYDNIDSIDQAVDSEFEKEEQNKDLEKVEKGRR